jgi:uncharacterized protein (DUF3084 family)
LEPAWTDGGIAVIADIRIPGARIRLGDERPWQTVLLVGLLLALAVSAPAVAVALFAR